MIDPEVSFGTPVTTYRGISTAVLTDMVDAGLSLDDVAAEYRLSSEEVGDPSDLSAPPHDLVFFIDRLLNRKR
jgi:Protein of unknown function (DUF433)